MALDPVFSVLWALGALAALLVATKIHTINNAGFPRIGIHPGPFNLKLWPARIHFILEGRILVHQGYYKVLSSCKSSQELIISRTAQSCQFSDSNLGLGALSSCPKISHGTASASGIKAQCYCCAGR